MLTRPESSELEAPCHTSFEPFKHVPDGNVLEIMAREIEDTTRLLESVSDGKADYRYAPEKWSIKEVVGHLADTERVMTTGVIELSASRAVKPSTCQATSRTTCCRRSFEGFDDDMLLKRGRASGCEFTVRALAYLICGHEIHHKRSLRERYL